jgi:hypothetical protein
MTPVLEKYAKGASPAARLLLTLRGDAPFITVFRLLYWVAMSCRLNPGANPKLYHQGSIALNVCLCKVRHQALALTDQEEKATAGMVVFLVGLEVLGEHADAGRQERDLYFR